MKKTLALCLMLIVLSISLLTSCSVNNYKPISLKYQNSDYVPYTDGEPKSFLVDLLNNGKWHKTVAKCDCDYTVIMKNMREIYYHSECGTFIDYDFDKSLTVSEEDRVKLNDFFADVISACSIPIYPGLPDISEDPIKGIEIYCWQDSGEWKCGGTVGTNRMKSDEEIRSLQVVTIPQMKKILEQKGLTNCFVVLLVDLSGSEVVYLDIEENAMQIVTLEMQLGRA